MRIREGTIDVKALLDSEFKKIDMNRESSDIIRDEGHEPTTAY